MWPCMRLSAGLPPDQQTPSSRILLRTDRSTGTHDAMACKCGCSDGLLAGKAEGRGKGTTSSASGSLLQAENCPPARPCAAQPPLPLGQLRPGVQPRGQPSAARGTQQGCAAGLAALHCAAPRRFGCAARRFRWKPKPPRRCDSPRPRLAPLIPLNLPLTLSTSTPLTPGEQNRRAGTCGTRPLRARQPGPPCRHPGPAMTAGRSCKPSCGGQGAPTGVAAAQSSAVADSVRAAAPRASRAPHPAPLPRPFPGPLPPFNPPPWLSRLPSPPRAPPVRCRARSRAQPWRAFQPRRTAPAAPAKPQRLAAAAAPHAAQPRMRRRPRALGSL